MRYLGIIVIFFLGCQDKKGNGINDAILNEKTLVIPTESIGIIRGRKFLDSLYTCECDQFISKLEEIPNKDSNAYRITIKSKKGAWKKSKLINTRPVMSRISYCNEFYTVVSFACGGPCHSELFVFTSDERPDEQYSYAQEVKNNPNIIGHIKNEEFEKLILHNLKNNKEMTADISESGLYNYGQMDSMIIKNGNIILHYSTETELHETKTINIKPIQ